MPDRLELEVSDFGPIVEAKVDLRPLTVFVGPSNTGKSYLAILIYALHKGLALRYGPLRIISGEWFRSLAKTPTPARETIGALEEMVRSCMGDGQSSGQRNIALPGPIAASISSMLNEHKEFIVRQLHRCFGTGTDRNNTLIRRGKQGAEVILRRRNSGETASPEHVLTLNRQSSEFRATVPEGMSIQIDDEQFDHRAVQFADIVKKSGERAEQVPYIEADREQELIDHYAQSLMVELVDNALPRIVGSFRLPAFYLPADRTGVMHAHSVVVSALIENAPTAGLRPTTRMPMLSGILADFLEQLIEIDQPPYRRKKSNHDRSKPIEEAILRGSVHVDRSSATNYPRFTYRPEGWKHDLPLMNASSMVSELAPVVLYLRHLVGPGNVLIVEEPESHLHPAMQVEFTRQLARLVKSGVRIIVTTHSEWLLEELANIVRRSKVPGGHAAASNGRDIALEPEQVGAWLFEPKKRPRGSVVKEIHLDESGLYPSGFDDVAVALHNDWADISSRIEENS